MLLLCTGIIAAAVALDVDDSGVYMLGVRMPVHCTTYETFGIRCPSCGLTRAMCYAAHGRTTEAFRMNAAWPAVAAVLLLEIPYRIFAVFRWPAKVPFPVFVVHIAVVCVAGAALLGQWLVYLRGLLL
jgi:hypothetical protein